MRHYYPSPALNSRMQIIIAGLYPQRFIPEPLCSGQQCGTEQYSTAQQSTVPYNGTVQHGNTHPPPTYPTPTPSPSDQSEPSSPGLLPHSAPIAPALALLYLFPCCLCLSTSFPVLTLASSPPDHALGEYCGPTFSCLLCNQLSHPCRMSYV